nr:hypothetical protein [uncultured Acetobacteroides sp.]
MKGLETIILDGDIPPRPSELIRAKGFLVLFALQKEQIRRGNSLYKALTSAKC